MIEQNELRIGNIVKHSEISSRSPSLEPFSATLEDIMLSGLLDPVPLTEEWLIKLGFEKDTNTSWFRIGYFTEEDADDKMMLGYNTESKRCGAYQEGDANGIFTGYNPQYVHQLQNLYFALTGKELTPALTDK